MKWSVFGPDLGKINVNDDNNFYEDDLETNHENKNHKVLDKSIYFRLAFENYCFCGQA